MKKDDRDWLEIFSQSDDDVFKRVIADFKDFPIGEKSYKEVLSIPRPFKKQPKNSPVASLIKLYSTKGSGQKRVVRKQLQRRFDYLDYSVQKKILFLFLEGAKEDRFFCYNTLRCSWDKAFDKKVIETWEKYHEGECARLVVFNSNVDYIKKHREELINATSYFHVCSRLSKEDKDYCIEKSRFDDLSEYAEVLYKSERTIDRQETADILWTTIIKAIFSGICHITYGMAYGVYMNVDNKTVVPSIAWDYRVMNCMRYLCHIGSKEVVAEAMHWDMVAGKMFQKLLGESPSDKGDYAGKSRDMRAFLKLAYITLPEDKRQYIKEDYELCHKRYGYIPPFYLDDFTSQTGKLDYLAYTESVTRGLLNVINKYHLLDKMTQYEWEEFYKYLKLSQMSQIQGLINNLDLEIVCPQRIDFVKDLLYKDITSKDICSLL